MTYNFDPDRWYDNEWSAIQSRYKTGRITQQERDKAVEALDEKLETMWERLDGSYQRPK
ncbi:MAG: hypothetical protein WBG37_16860 [Desulfobacterales bacterium]|jgi:hypothetical protein